MHTGPWYYIMFSCRSSTCINVLQLPPSPADISAVLLSFLTKSQTTHTDQDSTNGCLVLAAKEESRGWGQG